MYETRDPMPWTAAMLFFSVEACIATSFGHELLRCLFLAGLVIASGVTAYISYTNLKEERARRDEMLREWMEKAHREEKEDE